MKRQCVPGTKDKKSIGQPHHNPMCSVPVIADC